LTIITFFSPEPFPGWKVTLPKPGKSLDRARTALKAVFGKLEPQPSDADFSEERLKLDVAIFDFEWSSDAHITHAESA
jgi:hypothetical protein